MANAPFTAIRKAVRERIEGTLTSDRDITAGRFTGKYWVNMSDEERKRRAMVGTRYDVRITGAEQNESSPNPWISTQIVDASVQIIAAYELDNPVNSDTARDDIRAVAEVDLDILQQGLTWSESIDDTSGATATSLVSGHLVWNDSSLTREEWGEGTSGAAGVLEWEHNYIGRIIINRDA